MYVVSDPVFGLRFGARDPLWGFGSRVSLLFPLLLQIVLLLSLVQENLEKV